MGQKDPRSLLARLQDHHREGYLSLHMPGHKENTGLAPYLSDLNAELDITELPGFDDLHAPKEILADAMKRAAQVWGSTRSWLQVNGSSGALLAAIRGITRRGDKILVARHCHKSIYHAIELCGLEPVFLLPPAEEAFGLSGSISPEQVEKALEEHPDARLIVYPSPTYDGVLSDTAGICAIAHEKGIPVLVDEAHGAHLGLWQVFPPSAMDQGADLAVASLHKMLPSLTQTAVLHGRDRHVNLIEVNRQTGIFQSSSPSYLLMASMEGCIRLLEEEGEPLLRQWKAQLEDFDRQVAGLKHLRLPGHGKEAGETYPNIFGLDPAKIVISTRWSALSGVELMTRLREDYKIELEMALENHAVAMTGLGTDDDFAGRLATALLELDEKFGPNTEEPEPLEAITAIPPRKMTLEAAAMAPGGVDFLYDSMGKVCGEYIWAYPPGIPLITPGEVITVDLIWYVERLFQAGVKLVGTQGKPPFTTVWVGEGT